MGCGAKKPKKPGKGEYVTTNDKGEVLATLKVIETDKPTNDLANSKKKKKEKNLDDFDMDAGDAKPPKS